MATALGKYLRRAPAELMDEDEPLARKLAAKSPLAMGAAKEIINLGMEVDLESSLAIESLGFGVLYMTEDSKEGCSAFLEKRKPTFKDRCRAAASGVGGNQAAGV